MEKEFAIITPFRTEFTPSNGSTIRIFNYTRYLKENGINYKFYSPVKPEYVPEEQYVKLKLPGYYRKLLLLYNLFWFSIFFRPLSFILHPIIMKRTGMKELRDHSSQNIIWAHQEKTVAFLMRNRYKREVLYDVHGILKIQKEYIHGLSLWKKLWWFLNLGLENHVLKKTDYINSVTEEMKAFILEEYAPKGKIIIAKDGIPGEEDNYQEDAEMIEKIKIKHSIEEDEKIILFAGSLKKFGGPHILAESYCKYIDRFPKTRLIMIGSGQMEEEIKASIQKYNCEKQVVRIDFLPHKELVQYMMLSEIIVCPDLANTYNEIVPHIKLFDAFASRRKVLAGNFKVNMRLFPENEFKVWYYNPDSIDELAGKLDEAIAKEIPGMDEIPVKYYYKTSVEEFLKELTSLV